MVEILGTASMDLNAWRNAVLTDWRVVEVAPASLRSDRSLMLGVVAQNGSLLDLAAESLRDDRQVALAALRNTHEAWAFVGETLKNDGSFIVEATGLNSAVLPFAEAHFRAERSLMWETVKKNWKMLEHCSDALKEDWELVLMATRQMYKALQYAGDKLLYDRNFFLDAVQIFWRTLEYVPTELTMDRELFWKGVRSHHDAVELAAPELREDSDFMLEATKLNDDVLQHLPEGGRVRNDINFWVGVARELPATTGWRLALERYGPPTLKNNKLFMQAAVERDWKALASASEELKADPDLVAEAVRQCWEAAEIATVVSADTMAMAVDQDWRAMLRFLKDPYHEADLLRLIRINPDTIQAEELYDYKPAVLASVKVDGDCFLRFASTTLQADKEVVQAAVDQTWTALQYASEQLRGNRQLVVGSFLQNGLALQFATEALRSDQRIVLDAMSRDTAAFQFAAPCLHEDTRFWEALTRRFPHAAWKRWLKHGMRHPIPKGHN
eukprot:CAMPEP_0206459054 /NCGR_PEP_ID=MMETSP0324_2-20121206/23947_1 /ASSEMBLY_ACC=CAM_ASM_000836 /TAXON_ID=2866 /ORGANISM="Crypthecodinium cohnii, Strain Seligo" /LENGTH=498 /DNA_ID=CAMNT_0053930531 /DNA_START=68 /DNA_END=1564 /DNA_ORIENTATION=-